ncbi:N-acetylglucosaminyl-diphospho-decaprenol L-rhamnosyltransferase [Nocardia sp. GAS34]|uniref:glycosyltransferase family 2 protein n=1 Tax=unclassified Nocardia TaxID=2637762 RepID=UPI003D259379
MTGIDVVLVTFNSAALLPAAVESVRAQTVADQVRILVIDNASTDDTLAVARALGIEPIVNRNTGFGDAVNKAAALGTGDYVATLNPDAVLGDSKCLEAMRATLADEQVGIVGARMITDGKPYPNGRRFPSTSVALRHAVMGVLRPGNAASREYFGEAFGRPDADQVVDWVSGCCIMLRRPLWERLGGFDRAFWMYLEDADLCYRAQEFGHSTLLSGPAWVDHSGGQSSKFRRNKSLWQHHRSALIFYSRTRSGWKRLLLPAAATFLGVRLVVLVTANTIRRLIARP